MNQRDQRAEHEAASIRLAQHGDDAAWAALVGLHQQAVFRLAYLLLRDADTAEDIAQDVFIRAFRSLDRFDEARPLRPWLLQITTNLARNRQRSVGRYLGALRRWMQTEPAPMTTLGERSGQQWEAHLLWQAVQRLGMIDQEVLYLHFFLDLSESEMVDVLHIAPGTVKSRLHRALQRLRAIVDGEFPALRAERQL